MLFNYTAQANMLLLEGALPHQIDQAIESFGLNMGPFRMMDLVGLDLGWRARQLSGVESPLHAKIGDHLCDNDRFGQKMERDTIIIAKVLELQILLLKMKKYTKKYPQIMVLLEERYLMKRLPIDVFLL
jgi:3-hydroxyacyl-CoA dehydrogenase